MTLNFVVSDAVTDVVAADFDVKLSDAAIAIAKRVCGGDDGIKGIGIKAAINVLLFGVGIAASFGPVKNKVMKSLGEMLKLNEIGLKISDFSKK